MYDYGLIGNCQVAALESNVGFIDWLFLPRLDGSPVFGRFKCHEFQQLLMWTCLADVIFGEMCGNVPRTEITES